MSKYCAKRVNSENRALVREVVTALESRPENIDFSGRRVEASIFPVAELKTAAQEILRTRGPEALQYSSSHDYIPLKEELARRYARFGLELKPENFTVTNGSIQSIDMLMKVLVNEGDTIAVESPLAWRVRQTMTMYQPRVIEIPLQEDGVDLAALEAAMRDEKPKFFYCSPNYQEPTGVVYSEEQRAAIADLAKKYDCIVVEQDGFSEVGPTEDRPSYIAPRIEDRGIVIGSISQVVGPGLRIGWICCTHPVLMKYFTEAKQKTDSHANGLIQRTLWQYLANTDVAAQAARVREVYNAKREIADAAVQAFRGKAEVRPGKGGTFLWVTLPQGTDSVDFFRRACEAGVSVIPGKLFGDGGDCARSVYVNFAGTDAAHIRKGLELLAGLL